MRTKGRKVEKKYEREVKIGQSFLRMNIGHRREEKKMLIRNANKRI